MFGFQIKKNLFFMLSVLDFFNTDKAVIYILCMCIYKYMICFKRVKMCFHTSACFTTAGCDSREFQNHPAPEPL